MGGPLEPKPAQMDLKNRIPPNGSRAQDRPFLCVDPFRALPVKLLGSGIRIHSNGIPHLDLGFG